MKDLIKKSVVVIVMITTIIGYAKGENPGKRINKENTTTLSINNVEKGNKLLIKDNQGIVLYKETIQKSGSYLKGFDLSELPDGIYFFELVKNIQMEIIPFEMANHKAVIKKTNKDIIYKPYVRTKESRIFVTNLSLNKSPLKITIFYASDNVTFDYQIFSETIKNTQDIQRVYKLDGTKKGTYKIVINTEGKTFVEYTKF